MIVAAHADVAKNQEAVDQDVAETEYRKVQKTYGPAPGGYNTGNYGVAKNYGNYYPQYPKQYPIRYRRSADQAVDENFDAEEADQDVAENMYRMKSYENNSGYRGMAMGYGASKSYGKQMKYPQQLRYAASRYRRSTEDSADEILDANTADQDTAESGYKKIVKQTYRKNNGYGVPKNYGGINYPQQKYARIYRRSAESGDENIDYWLVSHWMITALFQFHFIWWLSSKY